MDICWKGEEIHQQITFWKKCKVFQKNIDNLLALQVANGHLGVSEREEKAMREGRRLIFYTE